MSFVRLCQTRETLPQEIEHYLDAHQNTAQKWAWTHRGLHVHPAPQSLFKGARIVDEPWPDSEMTVWLKHRRSPLLPLKRYKQFEDRDQRLRLHPCDQLIQTLGEMDQMEFIIRPLTTRTRDRMRKKAQSPSFHIDEWWDRFESRTWHQAAWRNLFGSLWRWSRQRMVPRSHDPKQSERHDREGPIEAILDKLSRPLFRVEIRATRPFPSFNQSFDLPHLGELLWGKKKEELILSSEELATLLSPPSQEFIKKLESEPCAWLPGPTAIPPEDRLKHLHILGKTGMGKSTAILELFQKDLLHFEQIMVMDPHGELVEQAQQLVPPGKPLVVLDPSDRDHPLALNPLEFHPEDSLEVVSSSLIEMFFALSKGSWGPRLEYLLRNTVLTLLRCPNTTLLDVPLLLTQPEHCRRWAHECKDMELLRFWEEEFLPLEVRQRNEMIAPLLNKVGPLFSTPLLRNIFGQSRSKFSFDDILSKPAIILVPLSKAKLGEDACRLLGMTLISLLHGALLRRSNRIPLALSLDEFQNFATPTLMTMLSESRKFGLAITLAHQYLKQVPEPIMDAVLGNVGSHMLLRTSYEDAERLAPLLQLETEDLINLPQLNAYQKILCRGQPQATTRHQLSFPEKCTDRAHPIQHFGRPRSLVEAKLKARYTKRKILSRP